MVWKRFRISSQMMRSCSSARRRPRQRWMPKPNEMWLRAFGRSIQKSSGAVEHLLVAVAGDVPHHHALALLDRLAADLGIGQRCAAHVRQRRLPAHDFRHEVLHQRRILAQLGVLVRELVQRVDAAGERVARGVVAADDQQDQVAEEVARIHVLGWRRCAPSSTEGPSSSAAWRALPKASQNRRRTPATRRRALSPRR